MLDVRAVLERHGALQRFGLSLLHKHFELSEGEILVESCDRARRVLVCRVERAGDVTARRLIPTSWRLDSIDVLQGCKQWCGIDPDTNAHVGGHTELNF